MEIPSVCLVEVQDPAGAGGWKPVHVDSWPTVDGFNRAVDVAKYSIGSVQWRDVDGPLYRITWSTPIPVEAELTAAERATEDAVIENQKTGRDEYDNSGPAEYDRLKAEANAAKPARTVPHVVEVWVSRGHVDRKGPRWVEIPAPYPPKVQALISGGVRGVYSEVENGTHYRVSVGYDVPPPNAPSERGTPGDGANAHGGKTPTELRSELFRRHAAIAVYPTFLAIANNSGDPNASNEELTAWAAQLAVQAADSLAAELEKPKCSS